MDVESVLARIADNPKLPTPPALTLSILDRANRPNCSIAEIGKLIARDPAMCGKMLRLVNSSLFGLQRSVTSIERALNLLGLNHVRSLVLSLSLPALRFQRASSDELKSYWKRSTTTAMVCRELAARQRMSEPDSEMVAGLLCDIGTLLLRDTLPEESARMATARTGGILSLQCDIEKQFMGVDHAETAAYVLNRWNLAADLVEPIRYHHRPADAPPEHLERASLLYFANQVANLHDDADRGVGLHEILSLAQTRYQMSDEALLTFLEGVNEKISDFASLIDVDLGTRESFSDLFTRTTENLTRFAVAASLDSVRMHEEKSQVERNLLEATAALHMTEEQLRHAQKLEAIGRLAGGVAHDFNNLLTVIIGNCELVIDNPSLNAEARELIGIIKSTGDRASELTRQLLAFSRKQKLTTEVVSINNVIGNMRKMVGRLIGEDIQLNTDFAEDAGYVRIDPNQIGQVILNLAVNARDAMPNGGTLSIETFPIEVGEEITQSREDVKPGRYAVLAVRDTGCGMDDKTLPQIFEPFFTTKEPGRGTGLGLATVHGIIRQSGGHITVSSAVGQGTVFHIYLPSVEEPGLNATIDVPVKKSCHGSETILVVEDEEAVREFLRRTLMTHGYNVLVASDGIEALEISKSFPGRIHLLMTDRMMPRMNGVELVKRLSPVRSGLKIIYMSGHLDDGAPEDLHDEIRAGYLQKPFKTEDLVTLVREALGETEAGRAQHAFAYSP
jgi:signal transduction histidine kinase/CheY-like chemotaxis protein